MFHKILKQAKPTTLVPAFIPKLEQIIEEIKEEKTNEQPQKPIIKKPIKPVFRT